MPTVYPTSVDTPKDGKFDFGSDFVKVTNLLLDTYQEAMNVLEKITKNPESEITDLYGVCNKTYKVRYITPSNVASYVDYLVKALYRGPDINVGDIEMLSVELIRQFVRDNKECVPIENTNVFPSSTYLNDRSSSMEQIVLACRNEYYDTSVYSKSDMTNRAKAIGDSVKLLDSLRFTLNMKKMVNSIPDILNRNSHLSSKDNMIAEEFIKRFIQTAILINLATVEQLIAYCIPRTSYNLTRVTNDPNKRLDYDYIGEAVDLDKYSPVFINLSHGGYDLVHSGIHKLGNAVWAHSSISFDPHMGVMYTMNGGPFNDNVYGKQKPGFQREALHSSKYNDILVRVYVILVPNDVVAKMKDVVANLETSNVKYDYKAIWDKFWDTHAKAGDNPYKQICSTFVNAIIALAGNPLSDEELASPEDLNTAAMVRPSQVLKLYEGPGGEYDYDEAIEKIKEFAAGKNTIPYSEQFVTEAYMLKTTDMSIRGKLPFNCNVRDIVLLDMSADYKDVNSAIKFIMGDSRSPIASLVRKYRTRDEYPLVSRILPMFMHIKPYPTAPVDGKPRNKWEAGMHTDTGWLDKITYGDEFLDGNYRDDALGNNKFTPATHTLKTLYDMFKCDDMKTNEDLANNIYDVACAIMDITSQFSPMTMSVDGGGTVWNREMVRDILVVLAEIMTRSMLKLFYNNTLCFSASDDMPDTMVPGYLYTESFVVEATSPVPNQKVGVNVTDASGKAVANKQNIGQKIAAMMKKFIQWLQTTYAKIAGKFSNDHKAEIDWITKNMQVNTEIRDALGNGKFNATLGGYVPFKLQVNNLTNGIDLKAGVDALSAKIDSGEIKDANGVSEVELLRVVFKEGDITTLKDELVRDGADDKSRINAIQNYTLFGTVGAPAIPTNAEKLTKDMWMVGEGEKTSGIVGDLLNTAAAVNALATAGANTAKAAADDLAKKAEAAKPEVHQDSTLFDVLAPVFMEQDPPTPVATGDKSGSESQPGADETQKPAATDKSALYNALSDSLRKVQDLLGTKVLNTVMRRFYASNYKIYRDVVAAYKAQANTQPAQQNAPQNEAEQPADASAEGEAPSGDTPG